MHFKKIFSTVESKSIIYISHFNKKKTCLFFIKKYKCLSFIVHYKGLTLKDN